MGSRSANSSRPNESDEEEIGGGTVGALAAVAGVAAVAAWGLSKWLGGNSDPEPNKRQLVSSSSSREYNHAPPTITRNYYNNFTVPNDVKKWTKPSPGWFKLNTDGMSSYERGDAAAGGLIRDDTGRWIVGFTAHLGCCDVTSAELQALIHGLRLARDQGIQRVEVETDCEAAYILIEKPDFKTDTHRYGGIVQECRRLMTLSDLKVKFRNVDREVNVCADAMATRGRKQSQLLKVWEEPPDEYVSLLVSKEMMNS